MPRTSLSISLFALTTAVGLCSNPALAQQSQSVPNRPKPPIPLPVFCSPPGAMSLDGSFFTIPLDNYLHIAEFDLNGLWATQSTGQTGFRQGTIGAPAGPLPTGGVVFNANGRLNRWDPGAGVTYMGNPSGAGPWTHHPSDVACGNLIMIIDNVGYLWARDIVGSNGWANLGGWLWGKPGLAVVPATGETIAAVVEVTGRVWMIEDVCGVPTWVLAGWGGPNAGYPGGDPLAYGTSVSSGFDGGKFYVTADYSSGDPTDLYETARSAGSPDWGWFNHEHPTASLSDVDFYHGFTGFASSAVPARDAFLILTTDSRGVIELALKYYDFSIGNWSPWINLGSPQTDTILADTLTSEVGANRIVVKGTSGKFWMCRNDGSGWFWYDLDTPM